MLEERRSADSRVAVIRAEQERIGSISILWVKDIEENVVSELRAGFSVEPADSSLGKLVQAYTAMGGNPLDISAFVGPESAFSLEDGTIVETVPHGGVMTGLPLRYVFDQGANAGDTNFIKYRGSRSGGNNSDSQEPVIWSKIYRARKWITQEIRFKRNRLEEQIIKLCDLREQLDQELSDLSWAMYGDIPNVDYAEERYNFSLSAGYIAYFMDSIFRVPDEDNSVPVDPDADPGDPGSPNMDSLGTYPTMLSDMDDEDNTAL